MSLVHRLVSAGLVLGAIVASLASCSSPLPVADDDVAASGSTDQALGADAKSNGGACAATTYFVLEPTPAGAAPSCDAVPGRRGTWEYAGGPTLQTCFSNADASVASVLCYFTWSSATGATPDVSALTAIDGASIAPVGGGGPAGCGSVSLLPYVALLDEAAVTCPHVPGGPGPNGPKGCDVCGKHIGPGVFADRLYVSSSTTLRTVAVSLSNGTKQIVTLGDLRSRGRYAEIALPTPPRGVDYEEGPALGYGYDSPAP